jgi:NADPH2:quinone reductase
MKAILCTRLDGPGALQVAEIPVPEPGPGEVRVRMRAAGVNFPDLLMTEGKYQLRPELPFVPGMEGSGIIDKLGNGVEGWHPGQPVMTRNRVGAFADYSVLPMSEILPLPGDLGFEQAAAFPVIYSTAYVALVRRGRLADGETLVVLGAGGGVGLAAVEVGAHLGAHVIAAASSEAKRNAAREAGAHQTFDYRAVDLRDKIMELTEGRGADVIFDPVGGDAFEAGLRALAWDGRLLVIGFTSGRFGAIRTNLPLLKGAAVVGVRAGEYWRRQPADTAENYRVLLQWAARGLLRPRLDCVLPLDDAEAALRRLAERDVIGKVVLAIGP